MYAGGVRERFTHQGGSTAQYATLGGPKDNIRPTSRQSQFERTLVQLLQSILVADSTQRSLELT